MKTISKMTMFVAFLVVMETLLTVGCGQETETPISVQTPQSVPTPPAQPVQDPVAPLPAEIVEEVVATPLSPVQTPQIVEADGIHLDEIVVARGIEKRQPVEPGTSFELDPAKRIYAFMRVGNPDAQESEVTVSWVPADGGKERGKVSVSVGAQKKWRTWAFTRTIKTPGMWKVLVRNQDGEIIAEAPFEVTKKS